MTQPARLFRTSFS